MKLIWRKSNREREQEKLLAEKAYAANVSCNAEMMKPREPYRPPHPCEHQGHEYRPIDRFRGQIIVFCGRCADVKRIPLQLPAPPKSSLRPQRFADLA